MKMVVMAMAVVMFRNAAAARFVMMELEVELHGKRTG